jgi:uncharacterized membrane protein
VKLFRRYLIAGLVVWLPLWATLLVLNFLVELLDKTVALLPHDYQPKALLGFHIPGAGVVLSLLLLFFTGVFVTNFFGDRLVALGERIVAKIPLVRSIYQAVKQVSETIFASNSQAFRKVLLIEYPRKGLWSVAFQTASSNKTHGTTSHIQNQEHKEENNLITVFVPTTPNPTSGFLILVNRNDAKELDISIDEALKMVISLGVIQPGKGVKANIK